MSGGDHVREDLMVNIFERLPIKSLVRLRSLSKYWYFRIGSREFIHNHRAKAKQKVLILHDISRVNSLNRKTVYTLHSGDQLPLQLDPLRCYMGVKGVEFPYPVYKTIGSCNGIICLLLDDEICMWNFSIRRKLSLPHLDPNFFSFEYGLYGVAFGFGFDRVTDDYKVLVVSRHTNYSMIFSLRENSWTMIAPPTTRICEVKSPACFLNGTLHWAILAFCHGGPYMLTFTLDTHVFGTISMPLPHCLVRQITVINGCLALFISQCGHSRIWVMSEYGNVASWCLLFNIEKLHYKVLQPIMNGDVLIYNVVREVYNQQTGSMKYLFEFGTYCCNSIEMEMYVESLELLDRGTICGETICSWIEKENYPGEFSSPAGYDDGDDDDHYGYGENNDIVVPC